VVDQLGDRNKRGLVAVLHQPRHLETGKHRNSTRSGGHLVRRKVVIGGFRYLPDDWVHLETRRIELLIFIRRGGAHGEPLVEGGRSAVVIQPVERQQVGAARSCDSHRRQIDGSTF